MAIHVALDHSTRYQYDRPVRLSPHVIRLFPAPHARTPIHDYRLDIEPANHRLYRQQDPFGNVVGRAVFPEPVSELAVHVRLVAEMTVINPFDFFVEEYAETFSVPVRRLAAPGARAVLRDQRARPASHALARARRVERSSASSTFWSGVNARLQRRIGYSVRLDPGIQTCEQTFETSIGSCRDSGWLLVQILRHMGLAARFVSGYLVQLTADEKSLDGPSGPEKDFTDLHAWAEVYVPGAGWIGLDADLGPVRRRGSHPARVHARSGERRAAHRLHRRVRGDLRPRQQGHARARRPARDQAVHRGAVDRASARSGAPWTARSRRSTCA